MLCKKVGFKLKRNDWIIQKITETLNNLHAYLEKHDILDVLTFIWKYIDIVNSVCFILWELEEMKSAYIVWNLQLLGRGFSGSGVICP